jgi:hypothetical protein
MFPFTLKEAARTERSEINRFLHEEIGNWLSVIVKFLVVGVRLFSALLLFRSSCALCYTAYVYYNQMACMRVDAVAVSVTKLASSRPSESLPLTRLLEWVSSKALLGSRGSISAFSLLF